MGSGIGSLDDVYETTVAYEKGVSNRRNRYQPQAYWLPRATEKCLPSSSLGF